MDEKQTSIRQQSKLLLAVLALIILVGVVVSQFVRANQSASQNAALLTKIKHLEATVN